MDQMNLKFGIKLREELVELMRRIEPTQNRAASTGSDKLSIADSDRQPRWSLKAAKYMRVIKKAN
jgi:hypothetical protein